MSICPATEATGTEAGTDGIAIMAGAEDKGAAAGCGGWGASVCATGGGEALARNGRPPQALINSPGEREDQHEYIAED